MESKGQYAPITQDSNLSPQICNFVCCLIITRKHELGVLETGTKQEQGGMSEDGYGNRGEEVKKSRNR